MTDRNVTAGPIEPGRFAIGVAVGLVALPSLAFAAGQLVLLLGGRFAPLVSGLVLAAVLAASLVITARAAGRWTAALVVGAIVVAATLACALILDTSYDGQTYHFDAITGLAHGWNPYRDGAAPSPLLNLTGPAQIYASHYPQGAWISSALQFSAGLPFEAAKNQPILLAAAVLFAVFGACLSCGLDRIKAGVVAVVIAANPVMTVQLLSRMNDGMLASCFALIAVFSFLWIWRGSRWAIAGAIFAMVVGLNFKFSAAPLFVALSVLICIFAWVVKGRAVMIRAALPLLGAGLAGILVFGAHPYVTNTLGHGHPFYPLMGEDPADIITYNRPATFDRISPLQRMAISYFAPEADSFEAPRPLKIPFSVEKDELRAAGSHDTRISGFGPLFSGALCIAFVVLVATLAQKGRGAAVNGVLAVSAGVFVIALIMPENWWARYVPYVWFGIVLIGLAALMSRPKAVRAGGWVLTGILLVNAGLAGGASVVLAGMRTLQVREQLAEFAQEQRPVCVFVGSSYARAPLILEVAPKVHIQPTPLKGCAADLLQAAYPGGGDGGPAQYCLCAG